jgi:hypothetical protein
MIWESYVSQSERVQVLVLRGAMLCDCESREGFFFQAIVFSSLSCGILWNLIQHPRNQTLIATILHSRLITLMLQNHPSA